MYVYTITTYYVPTYYVYYCYLEGKGPFAQRTYLHTRDGGGYITLLLLLQCTYYISWRESSASQDTLLKIHIVLLTYLSK